MRSSSSTQPWHARPGYRWVTALVGVGLMGLGGYLLWGEVRAVPSVVVSALMVLMGSNMVLAGWRGTLSWLARIGPLP